MRTTLNFIFGSDPLYNVDKDDECIQTRLNLKL